MHTQVKQLVEQLKKTSYKPRITCLGSRNNYCINEVIKKRSEKTKTDLTLLCKEECFKKNCGFAQDNFMEKESENYDF